jgi:uncharacterized membrane protein YraQ (UPF0718 family)
MNTVFLYVVNLLSETIQTVLTSLQHNWLVLAITIITAAAMKTYVNTDKLSKLLIKRSNVSIFASVLIGAFTPFCACGTTAVLIGMLTTTLPWGPIMAFLTSSPLMSPDGFILMSGVVSVRFAIGLTLASLAIGLLSGFATHIIEKKTTFLSNQTRYSDKSPAAAACSCSASASPACACPAAPSPACACSTPLAQSNTHPASCDTDYACRLGSIGVVFHEHEAMYCCGIENEFSFTDFLRKFKLRELGRELVNLGIKQILLYFSIFVAVGFLINHFVPTSIVFGLFGNNSIFAVPLASVIGLPLYVTTESAAPIIQTMIASGSSEGAMMAFIITGSATSAWVIAGLSTFLKKRAIALYVAFILAGGILSGYIYNLCTVLF